MLRHHVNPRRTSGGDHLVTHNLANAQTIIDARDEDLTQCVGEDPKAVASLRRLAEQVRLTRPDAPSLEELLSPPID